VPYLRHETQGAAEAAAVGLAVAYVVPIAVVVPLFGHMPPLLTYQARRGVLAAVVVIATFGAFRLLKHFIPRLLRVRILRPEEKVVFPLAKIEMRAEEETEAIDASGLKPTDDGRDEWTCKSCGEENPGNFDECWKCLGARSISGSGHKGVTDA
jgi:hypothetical protein